MSKQIDVVPTVETVKEMADRLRKAAAEVDHLADSMLKTNTLDRAGEVAQCITALLPNLRLDLLVNRPIRAYEKAARE